MHRTQRGRSHAALFRAVMRWPNMIPDVDVELPARLADWASLHGVPHICTEAALEYRQHCAPNLDLEQLKSLSLLAAEQREDGVTLGYADRHAENGEAI